MKSTNRTLAWTAILASAVVGSIGAALAEYPATQPTRQTDAAQKIAPDRGGFEAGLAPAQAGNGARGHYKTLLRQIEVPSDSQQYGDFCDYGFWSGTTYAGQENLRPGYWVYLTPNWYIFKEVDESATVSRSPRPWGPEQATGAPDTWPNAGDLGTSWASATEDGQREWLELTYDAPIRPVAVLVYETFNPGAVDRVSGYDAAGKEVELWSGSDPTPAGQEKGISVIPVHPAFDVSRIRIYFDSPRVQGWNEIDAVGLLDPAGVTHWAKSATASSTYADLLTNADVLRIDVRLGSK